MPETKKEGTNVLVCCWPCADEGGIWYDNGCLGEPTYRFPNNSLFCPDRCVLPQGGCCALNCLKRPFHVIPDYANTIQKSKGHELFLTLPLFFPCSAVCCTIGLTYDLIYGVVWLASLGCCGRNCCQCPLVPHNLDT